MVRVIYKSMRWEKGDGRWVLERLGFRRRKRLELERKGIWSKKFKYTVGGYVNVKKRRGFKKKKKKHTLGDQWA